MSEPLAATDRGPVGVRHLRMNVNTHRVWREELQDTAAVEVVELVGELDSSATAEFVKALADAVECEAGGRRVVVDTASMTFCGARGLGALHRGAELSADSGAAYAVAGLSPRLGELLTALWPVPHPALYAERADALAAVAAVTR